MTQLLSGRDATAEWRRRREDLRVRNDADTEREITVRVRDNCGCRHEATYELLPDKSGSALTLLSEGEYRVTAATGDEQRDRTTVRVSDHPAETIVVRLDSDGVTIGPSGR